MKMILIGEMGVGKSTVVRTVLEGLKRQVGGFYTRPILEEGAHKGFEILSFDCRRKVLAHVDHAGPRFQRYGVDLSAFEEFGVAPLAEAREKSEIIVMDEIGLMEIELQARAFLEGVRRCLWGEKDVLAVIQKRAFPWWQEVIENLPDARVLEVTLSNRDYLPKSIGFMV